MTELLKRILDAIGNPVLVAVIASFALTVLILWRLFEKQRELFKTQHEFIRERMDLYRLENEELRRQILTFRNENERLRSTSSMIVNAVDELRAQPLLGQKQLEELQTISEAAKKAVEESLPATKEVIENSSRMIEAVQQIARTNEQALNIQIEGFGQLQHAIRERASDKEILAIVQDLIHLVGESQRGLGDSIRDLEERALSMRRRSS
jgi:type II secretory pathway pseudopilin PulG